LPARDFLAPEGSKILSPSISRRFAGGQKEEGVWGGKLFDNARLRLRRNEYY